MVIILHIPLKFILNFTDITYIFLFFWDVSFKINSKDINNEEDNFEQLV